MTVYQVVANILIAAGYTQPAVFEQLGNYVLTSRGHDASGNDKTAKYVTLPGYNIPLYGAAFLLFGITTPPGIEKVGNLVLV